MSDKSAAFRIVQILRSVGVSLVINGLCPFLLYTLLEPRFPKDSVMPLLYASIFPVGGFLFGVLRKRMVDVVAVVVLLGLATNIATIFLTPSIKWALVARSLNGIVTATALLISALIGKPLFFYAARQFVTAADPSRAAGFDAANAADRGRTFIRVTLTWSSGIYALCALNAAIALTVRPATFLLASQITTNAGIVLLVIWTIRFTRDRLAPKLATT
ncbi:MAG TPA: VC0807 family protein [Rhizomicrobium sp.]|jgi:hypothetical protein